MTKIIIKSEGHKAESITIKDHVQAKDMIDLMKRLRENCRTVLT